MNGEHTKPVEVRSEEERTIERWMLTPGSELSTSAIIRYTGDWVRFEDHARENSQLRNDLTAVILERDALWKSARTACEDMGCYCAEDHDTTPPEMRSPLCRLGDLLATIKVKT